MTSDIQKLAMMRDAATERHHHLDEAGMADPLHCARLQSYGTAWLRQDDALLLAMLAATAHDHADALSVLIAASTVLGIEISDAQGDEAAIDRIVTLVIAALDGVVAILADSTPPPVPSEARVVELCRKQRGERSGLPVADRSSWFEARAAYEAARAADQAAPDEESDVTSDARAAAEDVVMVIPSPDAAAFAFKYWIAKGGMRETDCWDEMLDAEARRFAGIVPGAGQ